MIISLIVITILLNYLFILSGEEWRWSLGLKSCSLFFPQIYDTSTGRRILTLTDPNNCNNYSKNLASFNPTDDLVLNDGVLWDVKGKRVIHKFDKFNNFVSGVFHPSGLEIIINSEIVSFQLVLCFFLFVCYYVWLTFCCFVNTVAKRVESKQALGQVTVKQKRIY